MTANSNPNRLLTLLASAMIAGFVGDAALSAPPASAQAGVTNANLTDPTLLLAPGDNMPTATLTDERPARFSQTAPATPDDPDAEQPHHVQLELQAPSSLTGGLDISVTQRASIGTDRAGDLNRQGRGSEVRVGRALGDPTSPATRGGDGGRVYLFAGADDEAVTWQPGGAERGVALQDRVEVGDHQAGITYERNGIQASIAYVDRKISTTVGQTTASDRESFAGVTLTMRR